MLEKDFKNNNNNNNLMQKPRHLVPFSVCGSVSNDGTFRVEKGYGKVFKDIMDRDNVHWCKSRDVQRKIFFFLSP